MEFKGSLRNCGVGKSRWRHNSCPLLDCLLSEEQFPWICPGSALSSDPLLKMCHSRKEVRWRSRERVNGTEKESEIWRKGTSATVRIIVGEKCVLWHLITVSPSWSSHVHESRMWCQPVVFLSSCCLFVWKYKLKYHLWMFGCHFFCCLRHKVMYI